MMTRQEAQYPSLSQHFKARRSQSEQRDEQQMEGDHDCHIKALFQRKRYLLFVYVIYLQLCSQRAGEI